MNGEAIELRTRAALLLLLLAVTAAVALFTLDGIKSPERLETQRTRGISESAALWERGAGRLGSPVPFLRNKVHDVNLFSWIPSPKNQPDYCILYRCFPEIRVFFSKSNRQKRLKSLTFSPIMFYVK